MNKKCGKSNSQLLPKNLGQIEIKPSELTIKRGSNITVRCQTNLKRSNLTKNLKWKFCYNYQVGYIFCFKLMFIKLKKFFFIVL